MIDYRKHILPNGLTLIVMENHTTPLVSVNTLYNVGARDESPSRTGFAHLFEHLMFGGTRRVPDFDKIVNSVGGDSNAFTTNDYTDYHLTVPAQYLETALWLESDRMRGIDLSPKALQVQQSVVTEEYHYRYLNQPYGDVWMLLRPLSYKVHPYRWCTIGSDIRHVQEATLDDVRDFFRRFYCPANAILCVAGPVREAEVVALVEKWYGDIDAGERHVRHLPQEPEQAECRHQEVERDVPSNALYMSYLMSGRDSIDYEVADLLSDVLSNGQSSRLYNNLVKERALFTELDAYITGETDPGLFVVSGKLQEGVDYAVAQQAVEEALQQLAVEPVEEQELEKVVNKYETTFLFSQYKAMDCAMALCQYEWQGHIDWINSQPARYRSLTPADLQRVAAQLFQKRRQNELYYRKR